jgi:hypothetical protein
MGMNFIKSMFSDERGSTSHKRVIGFLCGLTLCVCMILNSVFHNTVNPSDKLIDSVLTLATICIAGTTVDKFSFMNKNKTPKI